MIDSDSKSKLVQVLSLDYVIAHRALVYYGKWTRDLNATGYANLRDALSHLRLFFDLTEKDKQTEQLVCAAEHIRRAATETYQECFELYFDHAKDAYSRYRNECMHLEEHLGYSGMFDHKAMVAELRRLQNELKELRCGKNGTQLNKLIKQMIIACEKARALSDQVDECIHEFEIRMSS